MKKTSSGMHCARAGRLLATLLVVLMPVAAAAAAPDRSAIPATPVLRESPSARLVADERAVSWVRFASECLATKGAVGGERNLRGGEPRRHKISRTIDE